MAKRFTDTEIWKKRWFRKLPPRIKCLWYYLKDNCDHAGSFDFDTEVISLLIGEEVNAEDLTHFGDRIISLKGDKLDK